LQLQLLTSHGAHLDVFHWFKILIIFIGELFLLFTNENISNFKPMKII